jgi:hypothetical protein
MRNWGLYSGKIIQSCGTNFGVYIPIKEYEKEKKYNIT